MPVSTGRAPSAASAGKVRLNGVRVQKPAPNSEAWQYARSGRGRSGGGASGAGLERRTARFRSGGAAPVRNHSGLNACHRGQRVLWTYRFLGRPMDPPHDLCRHRKPASVEFMDFELYPRWIVSTKAEHVLVINPDECIDCGVCEPECPPEAIKANTSEVRAGEMALGRRNCQELARYRPERRSGGRQGLGRRPDKFEKFLSAKPGSGS